ncbi:YfcZ/YiiS family protein [Vibrio sp. SS-MA-C1-2]|uniref:DUF406 family protein n=1 Tax=Vibrio sp. SS-MA-C1-2 TaxID=2908646 RepID=UPI001F17C095|nr:DUF406 family protein [Vibrio sp. SS-MA-C1-2]UJF16844.1 YfcZ/YiiS family protein [Vibrio sp. SS-MA-C1-2]
MTDQVEAPCEACGCAGEMGFIIKAGDEVATVTIFANGANVLLAELEQYLAIAREVNANMEYEATAVDENSTQLDARIQFECSAEKIIFELKSRSLNR